MSGIIRSFSAEDVPDVKQFTDEEIGLNYFSRKELAHLQHQAEKAGKNCSFVLEIDGVIKGFRLTYPPGLWGAGKGTGLRPDLWPHPLDQTGYFQSLFVCPSEQRKGWGQKLSSSSMEALKKIGAKGIVCHSWLASPGNSSQIYLEKMGFKAIVDHPDYWKAIDYECPLCIKPCLCTAREMYLEIGEV
ncbi:MAG: GNAT family N-acetyltransferase [Pseudomonadota bacterium]